MNWWRDTARSIVGQKVAVLEEEGVLLNLKSFKFEIELNPGNQSAL